MNGKLLVGILCFCSLSAFAAETDSLRVVSKIQSVPTTYTDANSILYLAKGFQGTPYAGGTLETFPLEHLVVRTDSVDCTTFVEYVTAMALTHRESRPSGESCCCHQKETADLYARFKRNLQTLRYRGGILDGYPSRLHYFSDWIYDNTRKGIVREVTQESPYAVRKVDLNFMSTHASLYPFLAHDTAAVHQMQDVEAKWMGYQMPYIPKERLNEGKETLKIEDGDILTLVTNLKGLDVVHVGFACWVDGKLHLLHASSAHKKVLLDPQPLYDYSRTKKAHIGIRVIRFVQR